MPGKRRLLSSALLIVSMSLGSLSCAAAAPQKQTEPKAEQNLIKEVRHQLVLLPYYSVFDNLSFQVQGSKVILRGWVYSLANGLVKDLNVTMGRPEDIEKLG